MTRLSPVLRTSDLPLAELGAARLDGELFSIDGCFAPVDLVENAIFRAGSITALAGTRLIAEQHTAAWIWGARLTPPAPHQFCSMSGARARSSDLLRAVVREVTIDDDEIIAVGDQRVTSPLRTVTDLARYATPFASREQAIVRSLMRFGRFSLDECANALDRRRNLPAKKRAWERLIALYG